MPPLHTQMWSPPSLPLPPSPCTLKHRPAHTSLFFPLLLPLLYLLASLPSASSQAVDISVSSYNIYGSQRSATQATDWKLLGKKCFSGLGLRKCAVRESFRQVVGDGWMQDQTDGLNWLGTEVSNRVDEYCLQCCSNSRTDSTIQEMWDLSCNTGSEFKYQQISTTAYCMEFRFLQNRFKGDKSVLFCRLERHGEIWYPPLEEYDNRVAINDIFPGNVNPKTGKKYTEIGSCTPPDFNRKDAAAFRGYQLDLLVEERNDGIDYWRTVHDCRVTVDESLGHDVNSQIDPTFNGPPDALWNNIYERIVLTNVDLKDEEPYKGNTIYVVFVLFLVYYVASKFFVWYRDDPCCICGKKMFIFRKRCGWCRWYKSKPPKVGLYEELQRLDKSKRDRFKFRDPEGERNWRQEFARSMKTVFFGQDPLEDRYEEESFAAMRGVRPPRPNGSNPPPDLPPGQPHKLNTTKEERFQIGYKPKVKTVVVKAAAISPMEDEALLSGLSEHDPSRKERKSKSKEKKVTSAVDVGTLGGRDDSPTRLVGAPENLSPPKKAIGFGAVVTKAELHPDKVSALENDDHLDPNQPPVKKAVGFGAVVTKAALNPEEVATTPPDSPVRTTENFGLPVPTKKAIGFGDTKVLHVEDKLAKPKISIRFGSFRGGDRPSPSKGPESEPETDAASPSKPALEGGALKPKSALKSPKKLSFRRGSVGEAAVSAAAATRRGSTLLIENMFKAISGRAPGSSLKMQIPPALSPAPARSLSPPPSIKKSEPAASDNQKESLSESPRSSSASPKKSLPSKGSDNAAEIDNEDEDDDDDFDIDFEAIAEHAAVMAAKSLGQDAVEEPSAMEKQRAEKERQEAKREKKEKKKFRMEENVSPAPVPVPAPAPVEGAVVVEKQKSNLFGRKKEIKIIEETVDGYLEAFADAPTDPEILLKLSLLMEKEASRVSSTNPTRALLLYRCSALGLEKAHQLLHGNADAKALRDAGSFPWLTLSTCHLRTWLLEGVKGDSGHLDMAIAALRKGLAPPSVEEKRKSMFGGGEVVQPASEAPVSPLESDPEVFMQLAAIQQFRGDFESAAGALVKARSLVEKDEKKKSMLPQIVFSLMTVHKVLNNYEDANKCLESLLILGPPSPYKIVDLLFILGRVFEEWSHSVDGKEQSSHKSYMKVFAALKKDQAVRPGAEFEEWVHDPLTWYLAGEKCAMAGHYSLASDFITEAATRYDEEDQSTHDPLAPLWFELAKCLCRSGRMKLAKQYLTRAIEIDRDNAMMKAVWAEWEEPHHSFGSELNLPINKFSRKFYDQVRTLQDQTTKEEK